MPKPSVGGRRVHPAVSVGERIGLRVVIAQLPPDARGRKRWQYQCDCGRIEETSDYSLKALRQSFAVGEVTGRCLKCAAHDHNRGNVGRVTKCTICRSPDHNRLTCNERNLAARVPRGTCERENEGRGCSLELWHHGDCDWI